MKKQITSLLMAMLLVATTLLGTIQPISAAPGGDYELYMEMEIGWSMATLPIMMVPEEPPEWPIPRLSGFVGTNTYRKNTAIWPVTPGSTYVDDALVLTSATIVSNTTPSGPIETESPHMNHTRRDWGDPSDGYYGDGWRFMMYIPATFEYEWEMIYQGQAGAILESGDRGISATLNPGDILKFKATRPGPQTVWDVVPWDLEVLHNGVVLSSISVEDFGHYEWFELYYPLSPSQPPEQPSTSHPDEGTITVHKYGRNTAGTAHPDNQFSGERLPESVTNTLGNPLAGAGFTLSELDMDAVNAIVAAGHTITGYTINEVTPSVTFHFDGHADEVATVKSIVGGGEAFTDASGKIQFGNADLADGNYLLIETTVPAGYQKTESTVIRLPLTLNDGLGENRDIHIYPKNVTNDDIVKKIVDGTYQPVNTNDIVPFKITTAFKNGLDKASDPTNAVESVADLRSGANYGTMSVTDQLESYFRFVDTTTNPAGTRDFDVYLVDGGGNRVTGANALVAGVDYNLTGITPGSLGPAANISVALTNAGIDKAIDALADALVITFDAQYTGTIAASQGTTITQIKNTASAKMAPHGGTTPNIPESTVYLPKAAIIVDKVDEEGVAFAGATFALARVIKPSVTFNENDWTADNYSAAQKALLLTEYVCDATGKPVIASTDSNGNIIFDGVPYTDGGATYYLKELSTQAGYELPVSTIKVYLPTKAEIATDPDYAGLAHLVDVDGNWVSGATVIVAAEIVNFPQGTSNDFTLPLTGGMGTTIFTVLGILLMAVTLYLTGKKKKAK